MAFPALGQGVDSVSRNGSVLNDTSDITLVLSGTVDPIQVGDLATYAATMNANPTLHVGEKFGYKATLSKSGGTHPLAITDLATMEIFYNGAWIDAEDAFGVIPFIIDGFGNLVYQFPDGIPGYTAGFPIEDPSWTWSVRFSFADTGIYTTTAELVDGASKVPFVPTLITSIVTVVVDTSDIALVLNGTVDPVHVGELATYAATMIANPAQHMGEKFGYKVTLSKSGGNHPLAITDLATMEIFYSGAWIDAEDAFGVIPFTIDGFGNLVYQFPDGIPGYTDGFPIQDPSWTWSVRFSFADTGTYTTTAELVDGASKAPFVPTVTASIATVVIAALPPTDIQLVLAGPAESVQVGAPAEYTGTMLANPSLHVGENFFVKVNIAKSGGTHAIAESDLSAMEVFYGGSWQTLPPGEFVLVGSELVYVFPQSQLPGGFPIQDAEWSWNFRFTYADTGTYTATAQVIDAADVNDPAPYAFDTAAISTTVVDAAIVVPDMNLLLLGPVEDVVVGSAVEYTGTLLASPSAFTGQTFWVRVRLSKNGGADMMTVSELEKMELYQAGNWQDATAALEPFLIQDGNDLVYLFPNPSGPFTIDAISWTWRFRFTYASEGLYTAVADVVDAAEADPLLAASLANTDTATNVIAAIDASLTMAGDALGMVVRAGSIARPSSFSATTHLSASLPTENVIAHLLVSHSGVAQLSDLDIEYRAIAQESPSCVAASPSGFWCPLPLIQNGNGTLSSTFGPASGFPLTDAATSYFRATFHSGGHYEVAVSIDGVDSATVYTSASHAVDVAELSLQSAGSATVGSGVTLDSTATLANIGTSAISSASAAPNDDNVIGKFSIERADETLSPGELTVSYLAPDNNYYAIALQACAADPTQLCGDFGPATGFPVAAGYNATSLFRTLFTLPGSYTVTTRAVGVGSAAIFAVSSQAVTVTASGATITIDPASLSQTYNGGTHPVIVTTNPVGLAYTLTYDGNAVAPTNAGTYPVEAAITAPGYSGSATANLVVDKAVAGVVISNTSQVFDGLEKPVTVATIPSGLSTFVTYDSNATPPSAVGSYAVLATVADNNYLGSASSTLQIVASAADTIVANGAVAFTGTAGDPLAGALPSVRVTDVGGNPVAGVSVTFVTGPASGSLSGETGFTDTNGIATLGGWIFDPTPGTDTVVASAAGVVGTVEFTATTALAAGALSVTISDGRQYSQFGESLSYTVTINNASNGNLSGVAVSDVLPDELELGSAQWQCIPLSGATCTLFNTGNLIDTLNLPARSSVVYLLSATTVRGPSDRISNTITATGPDGAVSATDITDLVLFRNGFEIGGDGAQSISGGFSVIGELAGTNNLNLDIRMAELGSLQVTTLARAADSSFRIEAVRIDDQVWLRLIARSVDGERSSAWSPMAGEQALLGVDGNHLLLAGPSVDLSVQLGRDGAFILEGALH